MSLLRDRYHSGIKKKTFTRFSLFDYLQLMIGRYELTTMWQRCSPMFSFSFFPPLRSGKGEALIFRYSRCSRNTRRHYDRTEMLWQQLDWKSRNSLTQSIHYLKIVESIRNRKSTNVWLTIGGTNVERFPCNAGLLKREKKIRMSRRMNEGKRN